MQRILIKTASLARSCASSHHMSTGGRPRKSEQDDYDYAGPNVVRGLAFMTSAKFSDFVTLPPPCPHFQATSHSELPYFVCFSVRPIFGCCRLSAVLAAPIIVSAILVSRLSAYLPIISADMPIKGHPADYHIGRYDKNPISVEH